MEMKRTLIGSALLAGMAMTNSAMAQDYDDRWYITAGVGYGFFDTDRNVNNELYGTLGFGKFITPNVSLDLELWHSNPELDYDFSEERNWELMSLSLVGRYHFGDADRWRPYIAAGIGMQEHHDGTQRQPLALGFSESRSGSDFLGILGLGVQGALGRGSLRAEIGARFDNDDAGNGDFPFGDDQGDNGFIDAYAGLSFLLPLGSRAEPVAPVAPAPAKTCADLDDDGDGVNNCDDKCPGSASGQAMGSDGCPVPAPAPEPEPEPAPKPFRG
jgi:OOP family OmpA-OmpF porin